MGFQRVIGRKFGDRAFRVSPNFFSPLTSRSRRASTHPSSKPRRAPRKDRSCQTAKFTLSRFSENGKAFSVFLRQSPASRQSRRGTRWRDDGPLSHWERGRGEEIADLHIRQPREAHANSSSSQVVGSLSLHGRSLTPAPLPTGEGFAQRGPSRPTPSYPEPSVIRPRAAAAASPPPSRLPPARAAPRRSIAAQFAEPAITLVSPSPAPPPRSSHRTQ